MLTQAAVRLPFCRLSPPSLAPFPCPHGPLARQVLHPGDKATRFAHPSSKPGLAALPQGRSAVVCAQGVNTWTACKVLEESDKASGGTRLLTTGQLEGQQARGRHTQEFSPSAPAALGMGRTKRGCRLCARHCPSGGGCRACVHIHRFLSPATERSTTAFNPEIQSWQVGSPAFNTCSYFAGGSFSMTDM